MVEPKTMYRGDSVAWTKPGGDYSPDDGWGLTYYFAWPGNMEQVAGVDDGNGGWSITIDTTLSRDFVVGLTNWQAVVVNGSDQQVESQGVIEVLEGFSLTESGYDARTFAEKALEAIEKLIADTGDSDETSFAVDGVSMSFESRADLLDARDRYRVELNQQRTAARLKQGGRDTIQVRI